MPDVTGRILILDGVDYELAAIILFIYGEESRDKGSKSDPINVYFTLKAAVPKVEVVARLLVRPS